MTRFDRVAVVDWSASSAAPRRRPQADAIWIGVTSADGTVTSYHPSRHLAELAISAQIDDSLAQGKRLLLGFDFPMGYPDGFAARLTGQPSAPAVWAWLNQHISDGPDNRNNRFAVADQINQMFGKTVPDASTASNLPDSTAFGNASASPTHTTFASPPGPTISGPFWGRPESQPFPHLPTRKIADYAALGLSERRRVEQIVPRAQPVWKLYTTGAAGGQSLTGLPLIHRLSQRPGVSVWPFQAEAQIVLAEVYPSLLAPSVTAALTAATIKDEVQVRLLSRALWHLPTSVLTSMFADPPPQARTEEGWILGAGHAAALLAAL